MRRNSQPTRGAVSLASAVYAAGATAPGSTGVTPEVEADIEERGALAVGNSGERLAARPRPAEWFARRTGRVAHGAGHAHALAHGGAAARTLDVPDFSAPSTPIYLVPDSRDEPGDSSIARRAALATKRAVDVLGAVIGLLLAAPLLAVFAVLIRAGSPGSVLFSQARVGRGGRVFRCHKLRTMRADAESLLCTDPELRARYEQNGFKIPCDADHRVTRIGRLLRLTSCDELPQLWNVLRGEMSLVGPRPLVVRELSHYAGDDRDVLLSVRPGLTGAWAVGGRSRVGYPRRAAIELEYVRAWSLRLDLLILFRTIGAVIARRGAA